MARVTVPKIQEFTIHPFGIGNLVVNGVQYTQLYNTNVTNTYISTNGGAFNVIDPTYPGGRGYIRELEVGLTAGFQANATTLLNYKWQGRNLAPVTATWVDIKPDELQVVNTIWREDNGTVLGRVLPQADFNSVPFEIRMQFRTNHADVGIARIKSSSWIRCLYQIN